MYYVWLFNDGGGFNFTVTNKKRAEGDKKSKLYLNEILSTRKVTRIYISFGEIVNVYIVFFLSASRVINST